MQDNTRPLRAHLEVYGVIYPTLDIFPLVYTSYVSFRNFFRISFFELDGYGADADGSWNGHNFFHISLRWNGGELWSLSISRLAYRLSFPFILKKIDCQLVKEAND